MKKRIISVLSFLMLVICLTGCSTRVTPQHIKELTEVATEVKNNPNYQMPEGYTLSYADNTKNDRIVIKTSFEDTGDSTWVEAVFDVSQDEIELVQIEEDYARGIYICILFMLLFFFIGLFLGMARP